MGWVTYFKDFQSELFSIFETEGKIQAKSISYSLLPSTYFFWSTVLQQDVMLKCRSRNIYEDIFHAVVISAARPTPKKRINQWMAQQNISISSPSSWNCRAAAPRSEFQLSTQFWISAFRAFLKVWGVLLHISILNASSALLFFFRGQSLWTTEIQKKA